MKIRIVQPEYSTDYSLSDKFFERELALLDQCSDDLDLIVFPEACDVPCLAKTREEFLASYEKYNQPLLAKAAETAKRCSALLFINAIRETGTGLRNSTYAFDRRGKLTGNYDKQHLTKGEMEKRKLDSGYTLEFSEPPMVEIEGLRFCFLTCYDFYFYEAFANIARRKPDIIIGCSHQRSDTHDALEIFTRNLAYNTNAYVVRSSVSMGEDSPLGGCSMVVAPDGKVLINMKSRIGAETVEIDVSRKYYKPAGFGGSIKPHYEYIEEGRRPWKYRPGGSAIVKPDKWMPYPRVCAHRGFNTIAPENSMPAYGAAVALGAEEIEFDLWTTRDGEIVSLHDKSLDRVSDGHGFIWEYDYRDLLKLDFGSKFSEPYKGLKILRFEEILEKFSCHAIMNIHVKTRDNDHPYDEDTLRRIVRLIEKYDCVQYCYFMSGNDHLLRQSRQLAPHIQRCVGGGNEPWRIVDRAIEMNCEKVQLFKPYFDQAMIDKAKAHGIRLNVFWSDEPEETKRFLDMGIDVILTNDFIKISEAVRSWKLEHTAA